MRILFVLLSLLGSFYIACGQLDSNEAIREKFIFEVVHIEEFMERFNFDSDTKLLEYLRAENPEMDIDRHLLLSKLIKLDESNGNSYLIDEFINFVADSADPQYLSYYDSDWYAELDCVFLSDSGKIAVTLILSPQVRADSSSKWVIQNVKSKQLLGDRKSNSSQILSPVSHNVDFAGLYNCLADSENLLNYFSEDFTPESLTYFFTLLQLNEIKLESINSIQYYFLQIPKWIFKAEYQNVKELQSGWLITELNRVSRKEKETVKSNFLN